MLEEHDSSTTVEHFRENEKWLCFAISEGILCASVFMHVCELLVESWLSTKCTMHNHLGLVAVSSSLECIHTILTSQHSPLIHV